MRRELGILCCLRSYVRVRAPEAKDQTIRLVLQETSIALLLARFHGFRCPPQVLSEMQYSEFDWAAVASLPTQLQRLCIAHVNLDFDARQTAGAPPFPHSSPHTGPRSPVRPLSETSAFS